MSEIKEKANTTEKAETLIKGTTAFLEEYRELIKAECKKIVDDEREKMKAEAAKFPEEYTNALRKATGIDTDVPITAKELPALFTQFMTANPEMVRKAMLEIGDSQKKTPAPEKEKAGSEAPKADPFEQLIKEKGLA
jgi:GTP-sensing pleiotropic transcriptional regulator CodY